ncbi:hypothetical protein ACSFXN_18295 [Planococcus sp. 1R117A]|uniref:hypothetical protein n=1 Tax=Planococcus sp. 1R117A TaxID=3447020 RepID=UPI003EDC7FF4
MQEQERKEVTIKLSSVELVDLASKVDNFIETKWPEVESPVELPSSWRGIAPVWNPVDDEKISAFRRWLLWLRGDVDRMYRNGIKIPGNFPTVPLIPKYAEEGVPIPAEMKLQHEKQKYNFYQVKVYFHSELEEHVLLKNVNLKLKFKDNYDNEERETVVTSMVPDNTYQNLLKSNTTARIAITANGTVKAEIPKVLLPIGYIEGDANVVTGIDSSTELTLPPIEINNTLISAVGIEDTECYWNFDEVQAEEDIQVIVILRVPQEATEVKVKASLEVTPYHKEWWPLKHTRLKGMRTSEESIINLST